MDNNAWLKELKIGEEVAVSGYGYGGVDYEIHTVTRVTPTGRITLSNEMVFNNDGSERGATHGYYHSQHLARVTDEIRDSIKKRNLLYEARRIKFGNLSTSQLARILEIVEGGD